MEGHLVLLDSAPLFCKESVKEQIRSMDPAYLNFLENKHQMLVLASIMQIVSPAESLQLKKAVVECSSWEECIDTLVDYADNQLPYSNFYLNNFINTMARRTMMIRDLNLDEVSVIKTPISLIRPKKAVVANIDENYDLARYTTGRFTMNYVDGDHISIINSTELSEIIMKIYAATHKKKTY